MRLPTSPVMLDQDQLWRAGLGTDYPGMIAAVRKALLELESGHAAGAKATVTPRDEDIRDSADPERSGFDLASEDLDWKLSALVSVNRRHGAVKTASGTLADSVKDDLYFLKHFTVGKVAPDIEGQDQDGVPFKLADYRGKGGRREGGSEY